jgi:hypothetical protein
MTHQELQLFAAELRAGRAGAIRRLRRAIEHAGSLRGAAIDLGLSPRTVEGWALRDGPKEIGAVSEMVGALEMRRAGASEEANTG